MTIQIISNCPNAECDNTITVTYSTFPGGENDSAIIYFKCSKCGNEDGHAGIKNPETASIKGGTKIKSEYLD